MVGTARNADKWCCRARTNIEISQPFVIPSHTALLGGSLDVGRVCFNSASNGVSDQLKPVIDHGAALGCGPRLVLLQPSWRRPEITIVSQMFDQVTNV